MTVPAAACGGQVMVVAELKRRQATSLAVGMLVGAPGVTQESSPVPTTPDAAGVDPATLAGQIIVDGSSTVWAVTAEVAERFLRQAPKVRIDVEISGIGGDFRRFCDGTSGLQNASRPITAEDATTCAANGLSYRELTIRSDGSTLVVNLANDWVSRLSVEQLRQLWTPGSTVRTRRALDPAWPNEPVDLYGPTPDSGTFDDFTEAIVSESGSSRSDDTPSESGVILVEGVEEDRLALGSFGYAYYAAEASDKAVAAVGYASLGGDAYAASQRALGAGASTPAP